MRNHIGKFRPVRGGIAILSPAVNQFGTLGLIATATGADRWLVTCFHVLHKPGPALGNQPVFQPSDEDAADVIATTDAARADARLDCAAALLSVAAVSEILGIGPIGNPAAPAPGMEVMKSGIITGITEGVIDSVTNDDVHIKPTAGFPRTYDLSESGDSGAVWVEKASRRPVALHTGGNDFGTEFATAKRITSVLHSLNLRVV